jgi:hypothetical protein
MRGNSRHVRRFALAFSLALLVGGVLASGALASGAPTNLTVTGGALDLTPFTVADFQGITLNGTAQQTTATGSAFIVNDLRGSGAGWHMTVQATQFTGTTDEAKTLPLDSLSMTAPTVAKKSPTNTSEAPTINEGPYNIDHATPVVISQAAANAGMGEWDYTQGGVFTLSVPANAYAVTYQSLVTVSTLSGP